MRRVLVNDPGRVPPHWTDLICPGEAAVFVFEAGTHLARDPDGARAESTPSIALCKDSAEANAYAQKLIADHPDLCCEIYDQECSYGQPLVTIYDDVWRDKHLGRGAARRQTMWGCLLLLAGSIFVVIDFRHDLAWYWGYIIGLKCLVIGITQLISGISAFQDS